MSNEVQRRWGIVALAVAMFFVTMINAGINGNKASFYYWVWMMVGWYGYKGNLEQIKNLIKFFIFLNIAGILFVILFYKEQTVGFAFKGEDKISLSIGILAMLIPKIFLYLYCDKQIKNVNDIELNKEEKNETTTFQYEEITKKGNEEKFELNFRLTVIDFKEKYGVNDYDLAKAKNELSGKIATENVHKDLMQMCRESTASEKEAEKKYIFTRAYQISKSANRNEPHIVQSNASETFEILKRNGYEFSTKNETSVNYFTEPEKKGMFTWGSFLTAIAIVVAVVIAYNAIGFGETTKENKVQHYEKVIENKIEPNFYNSDMSYELKNCIDVLSSGNLFSYKKLKTSIADRDALLIGEGKKSYFEECFLNGRYYQCTNKTNDGLTKITFDVIEMNFWQEDSENSDATKFNMKFECDVR